MFASTLLSWTFSSYPVSASRRGKSNNVALLTACCQPSGIIKPGGSRTWAFVWLSQTCVLSRASKTLSLTAGGQCSHTAACHVQCYAAQVTLQYITQPSFSLYIYVHNVYTLSKADATLMSLVISMPRGKGSVTTAETNPFAITLLCPWHCQLCTALPCPCTTLTCPAPP